MPTLARRFRIYIGYSDALANPDRLVALATVTLQDLGFDNFTRYIARGFWNAQGETSVIFEVVSSSPAMPIRIHNAAERLKTMPEEGQEAVLVTIEPVETYLV